MGAGLGRTEESAAEEKRRAEPAHGRRKKGANNRCNEGSGLTKSSSPFLISWRLREEGRSWDGATPHGTQICSGRPKSGL